MIKTLITRPRAFFAGIIAIGAASLTFVTTEPSGDPQVLLSELERRINLIEVALKHHTYEVKNADSPKPVDESRALYELTGPKGENLLVEGPVNPNHDEVERIVYGLYVKGKEQHTSFDAAWPDVQILWQEFTLNNQLVAEAKALRFFDTKPERVSSYSWDNHFRKSQSPWQVQEDSVFQSLRAVYTAGAAVGSFVAVISILVGCGWVWRAVLARIRELSNAIQGK